jgi:hypothetical protein
VGAAAIKLATQNGAVALVLLFSAGDHLQPAYGL